MAATALCCCSVLPHTTLLRRSFSLSSTPTLREKTSLFFFISFFFVISFPVTSLGQNSSENKQAKNWFDLMHSMSNRSVNNINQKWLKCNVSNYDEKKLKTLKITRKFVVCDWQPRDLESDCVWVPSPLSNKEGGESWRLSLNLFLSISLFFCLSSPLFFLLLTLPDEFEIPHDRHFFQKE